MHQQPSRFKVKVRRPPNVMVWEILRNQSNEKQWVTCLLFLFTIWVWLGSKCQENGQGGGWGVSCRQRRFCIFFLFISLNITIIGSIKQESMIFYIFYQDIVLYYWHPSRLLPLLCGVILWPVSRVPIFR